MSLNTLRGSVRPVVAYLFAAAVVAGFFLGSISQDAFLAMASMIIGFWFQSRTANKEN